VNRLRAVASAADLKFLYHSLQSLPGTSNRKQHWNHRLAGAPLFSNFVSTWAAARHEFRKRGASLALGLLFACFVTWPTPSALTSRDAGLGQGSAPGSAQAQTEKKGVKAKAKAKQAAPKVAAPKGPPKRIPYTAEDAAAAVVPGFPDARVWGDDAADFQKVLSPSSGPWLAMSGGGADGAFAAGVLTGWTQSGKRPDFTVVTGVSIGALIAPYAFLGSKFDDELRSAITTITGADIFEDRPTHESFLDTWPLRRLIEKRVTPELVAGIAAEHKKGRRLLVVTTNVDSGRRVIWDMGAIAQKGDESAVKLFRDVLLASSAIPGFFTPILIDVEANGKKFQELHIDGSVTSPFFVAPEALLEPGNTIRLPATELYIVLNARMGHDFYPPERSTVGILSRLIGVVLKVGLRAEAMLFAANAQRLGMPMHIAQVSDSFQHPAHGLFDEKYMNALFEHGAERARSGTAFEPIAQAAPATATPEQAAPTQTAPPELRPGNP
jgi:predicted acylesterase/phospholipase RssA